MTIEPCLKSDFVLPRELSAISDGQSLCTLPLEIFSIISNTCSLKPNSTLASLSLVSIKMRHICWNLVENDPFLFNRFSRWFLNIADAKNGLGAFSWFTKELNLLRCSLEINLSRKSTFSMEKCQLLFEKFLGINGISFSSHESMSDKKYLTTLPLRINSIIENCRLLKTVNLSDCWVSLKNISFPDTLENLNVSYITQSSEDLGHVSRSCPSLKNLIMSNCSVLPEEAFNQIALPKSLEKLDVTNNKIGIGGLSHIAAESPSLKTLLFRCYGGSPKKPPRLAIPICIKKSIFPKTLQKLHIDHRLLTGEIFSILSKECLELTELSIHSLKETKNFGEVCLPKKLKKMTVCPAVTDLFLASICRDCVILEELTMHSCRQLTAQEFAKSSLPSTMSLLSLSQLRIGEPSAFNAFWKFATELKEIHLKESEFEGDFFENVKWPKKIVKANFALSPISSKALQQFLNENKQLTSLSLGGNRKISRAEFNALSFEQFLDLGLEETLIDDQEVESIKTGLAGLVFADKLAK